MFEEFRGHILIGNVHFVAIPSELECDAQHGRAVESHPSSAIGLLERPAGRQRLRSVEHTNIIQPKEAAFEKLNKEGNPYKLDNAERALATDPNAVLGPEDVEVEVRAAALNFRDVAVALGMYPTSPGMPRLPLGCDEGPILCARVQYTLLAQELVGQGCQTQLAPRQPPVAEPLRKRRAVLVNLGSDEIVRCPRTRAYNGPQWTRNATISAKSCGA